MAIKSVKSTYPHVKWIDLKDDGVLHECAVMKEDANGNMYFFPIVALDTIDKQRLFKVITNRNAELHELWDLMSQITLGNGMNALAYFHQLVKILTPSGKILTPRAGEVGAPMGQVRIAKPAASEE